MMKYVKKCWNILSNDEKKVEKFHQMTKKKLKISIKWRKKVEKTDEIGNEKMKIWNWNLKKKIHKQS